MSLEGFFVASSGKMMGEYRERRYEYEVIQIDREDGTTIPESEKEQIGSSDLLEADKIMYRVTGGHLGDQVTYRWVAGPYPSRQELEDAIEDQMIYESP